MSLRAALPVLYGLCDEWTARAQLLAALGGKPEALTESLAEAEDEQPQADVPGAREARIAQVAALARAMR